MRWGIGDRAAAALVNAVLIDFQVVTAEDTRNLVDRAKIRRAKKSLRDVLNSDHIQQESLLTGLYFDGKEVLTLETINVNGVQKTVKRKREHTVLVSQPEEGFLTHVTTERKTARVITAAMVEYLEATDQLCTVMVMGADSTATNTGPKGGVLVLFEKYRGRRVHWSICLLHTNEPPLRHLFMKLDGATSGVNSFKGPIGKSLVDVQDWEWNYSFTSIPDGPDLPTLPDEVLNNLSSDQKFLYYSAKSIKSGNIEQKLLHWTPGPLCHSRWLTLGCRIMMAYMKKNPFKFYTKYKLYSIVFFVVTNYVPLWFAIKTRPHIADAADHVLKQVQLLRLLPVSTCNIVVPYVKSWHAHPENLLVSLMCSEDDEDRKFAVEKILALRDGSDVGDTTPRQFEPPNLNLKAVGKTDLIDWKAGKITESVLTSHLAIAEIEAVRTDKLEIPHFPSHSQSVERMIREMTDACGSVAGTEARDGLIRARLASRASYSKADTKKDFTKMVVKRE